MNIAELLTEAAAERPRHPAFLFEDQALTYAALDRRTDRFAGALAGLGLGAGEVAAIWLGTSLQEDNPFNTPWRREKGGLWDVGPHALSVLIPVLGDVTEVARRAEVVPASPARSLGPAGRAR